MGKLSCKVTNPNAQRKAQRPRDDQESEEGEKNTKRPRENSFALRTSLEWSEIASKLTSKEGRKGKKELKTQLTDFKLKQDMQI